jgi:hypothetical protein
MPISTYNLLKPPNLSKKVSLIENKKGLYFGPLLRKYVIIFPIDASRLIIYLDYLSIK